MSPSTGDRRRQQLATLLVDHSLGPLSDQVGLELVGVETDVPTATSHADALLRVAGTNDLVVVGIETGLSIEAQAARLRACIADLGAAHAVWAYEGMRAERPAAVAALNQDLDEGIGCFGVQIRAFRLQGRIVNQVVCTVEPPDWRRDFHDPVARATFRRELYARFWEGFIWDTEDELTDEIGGSLARQRAGLSLSLRGLSLWLSWSDDVRPAVALMPAGSEASRQEEIWRRLVGARDAIDGSLPGLIWEGLDGIGVPGIHRSLAPNLVEDIEREDHWRRMRVLFLHAVTSVWAAVQPIVQPD